MDTVHINVYMFIAVCHLLHKTQNCRTYMKLTNIAKPVHTTLHIHIYIYHSKNRHIQYRRKHKCSAYTDYILKTTCAWLTLHVTCCDWLVLCVHIRIVVTILSNQVWQCAIRVFDCVSGQFLGAARCFVDNFCTWLCVWNLYVCSAGSLYALSLLTVILLTLSHRPSMQKKL